ncbi:hypothetical protein V1517DRAFT_335893, partial [Lipomyces orientalis]
MHTFFKSPFFNFEFLRLLTVAPFEGGEMTEILKAVSKIKDLDPESWYDAWSEAGTKAKQIAREGEDSRDQVAAHHSYLRAAQYLQSAIFMLNKGPISYNKRVLPTIERPIRDFRKGALGVDTNNIFLYS